MRFVCVAPASWVSIPTSLTHLFLGDGVAGTKLLAVLSYANVVTRPLFSPLRNHVLVKCICGACWQRRQAMTYLRLRRSIVNPHEGFMAQLEAFETKLVGEREAAIADGQAKKVRRA